METLTPGQIVNSKDFSDLLSGWHDGYSSFVMMPFKATSTATATEDEVAYNLSPTYRYYFKDNSYVEARKNDSGDYQVIDYKLSTKAQAAQNRAATAVVDTPAEQTAAEVYRQKKGNQDKGLGFYTDDELAKDAERRATQAKAEQKKTYGAMYQTANGYVRPYTLPDGTPGVEAVPPEQAPKSTNKKTYGTAYQAEGGQWMRPWTDTEGNTGYEPMPAGTAPKQPDKPLVPLNDGSGGMGTRVEDPNAPGGFRIVKVEGTGTTGKGAAPQISDVNAQFGEESTRLRTIAAQLADRARVRIEAGEDSKTVLADYTRDLTTERDLSQAHVNEITAGLTQQQSIMQGERGEAQSRRQWADQAFKNANTAVPAEAKRLGPTVGADYAEAKLGNIRAQYELAKMTGGFNTPERTALQQTVMDLPGGIRITTGGAAQGGGPGGAPPGGQLPTPDLATMGSQYGAAPAAAPVAAAAGGMPGGLPPLPGGGFLPPGNSSGLGFQGGQLTAPGFSEGQTPPPFSYSPFGDDGDEPLGAGTGLEDLIGPAWGRYGGGG